jgi:heavy metal sensor kinase
VQLKIRHRLALVCAALVAALIVALGAIVYLRLEADMMGAVDDELRTRAEALVAGRDVGNLAVSPTDVGDIFAQRLGRDGRLLETSPGLLGPVLPAAGLATLDGPLVVESLVPTAGEAILARMLALPAPDGTVVIAGVTVDDQRMALATLLFQLIVALPVAMLLAAAVGWIVAGAALRPIERMRLEAEAISAAEPERRLPVPLARDELAALGVSLNRMLERLQVAAERERRFVDDASHELRTPLANLKAELDLALAKPRSEDELVASLRSAAEETDRLTRLAQDLLVLARSGGGRLPIRREEVDVGTLVRETVDSFAGRVAGLGMSLEAAVADGVTASLDRERVRQALANLIDNGLRHASPAGRVSVTVEDAPSAVTLRVADSGDGFPVSFLPSAFEPFSRADGARSRSAGGAGLGLAIVRSIVEAHGGAVEARNRPEGGAEVLLRLPRDAVSSSS